MRGGVTENCYEDEEDSANHRVWSAVERCSGGDEAVATDVVDVFVRCVTCSKRVEWHEDG